MPGDNVLRWTHVQRRMALALESSKVIDAPLFCLPNVPYIANSRASYQGIIIFIQVFEISPPSVTVICGRPKGERNKPNKPASMITATIEKTTRKVSR